MEVTSPLRNAADGWVPMIFGPEWKATSSFGLALRRRGRGEFSRSAGLRKGHVAQNQTAALRVWLSLQAVMSLSPWICRSRPLPYSGKSVCQPVVSSKIGTAAGFDH